MSYWLEKIEEVIEKQIKEDTPLTVECIPGITLTEFARRDIAVEIYSDFLQCNLWLCSNNEMATQLKKDAPEQVCYTLDELRHLISLNPDPKSLQKINSAKSVFPGSTLKAGIPYEVPEVIREDQNGEDTAT